MNRRGIEFTLVQVEPDMWQWQFRIGETVTDQNKAQGLGCSESSNAN
jgi:hypothetical protein